MYSIFLFFIIISVALILAGLIGKMGSDAHFDPGTEFGAALGLLITYVIFIICCSSFPELVKNYGAFIGGIPGVELISEYGSVLNGIHSDPLGAAEAFLDAVILSAIISVLELFYNKNALKHRPFMYRIFLHVLMALVGLLVLNVVVKNSGIYRTMTSMIGLIISIAAVGSISLAILSAVRKNAMSGLVAIAGISLLMQSRFAGILRSAFLKAVIYFAGVIFIEQKFGSVSNGLLTLSNILVAFGPAVIILLALAVIIRSVFK